MLEKLRIENYKSIDLLELNLGRVNVFIGENGCGKSNILEAIALGAAASSHKLDNEFLATRGIRVTEPKLMRSAFNKENLDGDIKLSFIDLLEIGKPLSELRISDSPLFADIPNADELTNEEYQAIKKSKRAERATAIKEIKL